MGNDEVHIRKLPGEQLADRDLSHHIVENRYAVAPRDIADLARDARIVTVHLDSVESILFDRFSHHRGYPAAIAFCMNKGEAVETVRAAGHDSCDLSIGHCVVDMKGSEQH